MKRRLCSSSSRQDPCAGPSLRRTRNRSEPSSSSSIKIIIRLQVVGLVHAALVLGQEFGPLSESDSWLFLYP